MAGNVYFAAESLGGLFSPHLETLMIRPKGAQKKTKRNGSCHSKNRSERRLGI